MFSHSVLDCECNNLLRGPHITTLGTFCKNNALERKAWLRRTTANHLQPRQARWVLLEPNSQEVKPIDDICKGANEEIYPVIKFPAEKSEIQLIIGIKRGHSRDQKCTFHKNCECKVNFTVAFVWGHLFTADETRYFYNIFN